MATSTLTQEELSRAQACTDFDKDSCPDYSFVNPPPDWESLKLKPAGEKRIPAAGEYIYWDHQIYLYLGGEGRRLATHEQYEILIPDSTLDEFLE